MRSAVIVAVLLFVASANAMAFNKLKAQRQAALQLQHASASASASASNALTASASSQFILKAVDTMYPGCADIGEAKCKQLVDAAAAADVKVKAMVVHLMASGRDAHFTAAFGAAAPTADVLNCLTTMALDTSVLKLWNAWANKDGSVYTDGDSAWVGFGVITGTPKLLVGAAAYSWKTPEMADHLVHEASHAFCGTVDLHNGLNGYKDSSDFDAVKGATNADSYRVYAQLVSP